ncbi:MAG TPA: CBS and ACT domain-containing protein [Syntrophales bacterium]|nr:CBS and ACT domain-containing protein [Syntrophales bacterium]HPI57917.1 CBS and ACT domain-containing protein [Syntrophales bacterium]HPN24604.1 CBS and ACT domain-containing protein [Syntrophales bacterium]HQM28910.1 CBS and ACT domain-containing protein [Syntrophales bacterium]
MFVGRRMTRSVVTVTRETSVLAVRNILQEHQFNQVPVVDGKRVVGIITDGDIRENSASPASTLSVHELNYLLSEMKAGDIMTKDPVTVTPETPIEAAAEVINRRNIGSLPVVSGGELVGIIATSDLLNVLLEVMGMGTPSSRIELTVPSDMGELEKIAGIVKARGLTIISMVSSVSKGDPGSRLAVIRVNTEDVKDLCKALRDAGYRVTTRYEE